MLRGKGTKQLVWSILMSMAVMPAAIGQTGAARSVISVRHVADAMASAGIAVNPDQIELLSGISASRETASVQVVSVTDRTAGTVKVKLRCQDNQECLPFYVLVHGIEAVSVGRASARRVPAVKADSLQNIIRGGDHATLILESPDSRMSLPVICLESGVRGQRIRVTSPDHRQFFDAEVVASGMVRGSL
jgi:flagella basal body P-ring formation protein FlgA